MRHTEQGYNKYRSLKRSEWAIRATEFREDNTKKGIFHCIVMSSFCALFLLRSVSLIERVYTADKRDAFICSWSVRRKSNLFDTFLPSYRYVIGFKPVLEHTSLSINCLSSTLLQKLKVLNLITDLASTRHFCSELGWQLTAQRFHSMHHQVYRSKKSTFRLQESICVFFYGFQNKQRLFPCPWLNFVNETECLLRGPNCVFI
jgi:hypothetical protein